MSGVRPKGPERPQQSLKVQKQAPEPKAGDADTPPPVTRKPVLEGRFPVSLQTAGDTLRLEWSGGYGCRGCVSIARERAGA
jgi:hypothetical protein